MLKTNEGSVESVVVLDELVVGTYFLDFSILDDGDDIGVSDGGEAVGDDYGGAADGGLV